MRKHLFAILLGVTAFWLAAQTPLPSPSGGGGGGGGGGSCASLGGDLTGTCASATVVNGSSITNSSIPNSGLVHPSMTVNGTTCTLGASCTPSSGVSTAGTFYLTSGGNSFGPVFPVTPPNTVSFSWRNQGTATETAIGNALYLLAAATASTDIKGREIVLPARPVSIAVMIAPAYLEQQFGGCGLYLADNTSGKIVTFMPEIISNAVDLRVDHFASATGSSSNAFSSPLAFLGNNITIKIQDDGVNDNYFYSTNGGQTYLPAAGVFSESRTVFLAAPDRIGYFCLAANATWPAGVTLLSWLQGT